MFIDKRINREQKQYSSFSNTVDFVKQFEHILKDVLTPGLTNTSAIYGPLKSTLLQIKATVHASSGKISLAV